MKQQKRAVEHPSVANPARRKTVREEKIPAEIRRKEIFQPVGLFKEVEALLRAERLSDGHVA